MYLAKNVQAHKTVGTANVARSVLSVFPYALYLFAERKIKKDDGI